MQMWFRKSKESRRCMHLFRFVLSFSDKVERTRSSMRDASRYFCTERIILTAHFVFLFLSKASTTFPKVPWPRSLTMESADVLVDKTTGKCVILLTSLCQIGIWGDNVMTVFIINLLMLGDVLQNVNSCQTSMGKTTNIVHYRHMDFRCLKWRLWGWYIDCIGIVLSLSFGLSSRGCLGLRSLSLLANGDIFVRIACTTAAVRAQRCRCRCL
jgi:hypothetical protein